MTIYKPTWLYIKQHNVTGLKYFGMTRCKYVNSYPGSGKYWRLHLKKHGRNWSTIWSQLFYNEEELVEYATTFSKHNNIVESKEWANLVPETGIYGKSGGSGWNHTTEAKRKIGEASKLRPPTFSMLNKHHTDESKSKTSEKLKGRKRPDLICTSKSWNILNIKTGEIERGVISLRKWAIEHVISYQLLHRNAKAGKSYKDFLASELIDLSTTVIK